METIFIKILKINQCTYRKVDKTELNNRYEV